MAAGGPGGGEVDVPGEQEEVVVGEAVPLGHQLLEGQPIVRVRLHHPSIHGRCRGGRSIGGAEGRTGLAARGSII